MYSNKEISKNKIFKTVYGHADKLAVRCKIIVAAGTVTNYLINIKDNAGALTVLLDKDGNTMISQVRL